MFGNQRPPVKYSNLFKGNLTGLIIILSLYALLPKSIQFSRAIILGSSLTCLLISLFTRTTFGLLKIGLFKGFTDFHKNIALVGSLDEIQRTEKLMLINNDRSRNIFKISSDIKSQNQENFHGNISQLNEFININKITEVIFCAKDISAQNIIYSMAVVNSKKNIDFKIIPEKTQFIIGLSLIHI